MSSSATSCFEKLHMGNCSKGEACVECNNDSKGIISGVNDLNLNSNAKVYVPKSRKTENSSASTNNTNMSENNQNDPKLNLNLNAQEFVPKTKAAETQDDDEDYEGEEFDMMMNDIIDNEMMEEMEEEESDDEKWMPKYKDCECCKGFVYKCKGTACVNLGICHCKMREECDEEEQ